MQDFKQLKVWEKSHRLVLSIYKATAKFPRDELYGLTSQMRRSSASIPANIAEGCGRNGAADFARFLQMAIGSASELEYQLLLCLDLKFISMPLYEQLFRDVVEVKRMLTSLIQKLNPSCRRAKTDN